MMTIESLLERIASSCERQERLIEQLLNATSPDQHPQVEIPYVAIPNPAPAAPTPAPAPAPTVPAPVPAPAPAAPAPAPTVPPPAPTAPIPAPAAAPAAFADQKAFMDYCMAKYKALGPIKGGMIQQILIDLGASSIMGLPAEKWAEFRAKVEML